MNDVLDKISKWAKDLRYPENWVIIDGAISIIAILIILTEAILIVLGVTGLHQLEIVGTVIITSIVVWFVARRIYWHLGSGRKIGVSYDGYKTPMDDWVETRRELSKLVRTHLPKERVHLKLIPKSMVSSEARWSHAEKTYGFTLLLKIDSSPSVQDPTKPTSKCTLHATLHNEITKGFLEASTAHLCALGTANSAANNLKDVLNFHASTLFDQILFLLTLVDYTKARFTSAAIFVQKLDERIASRWTPNQYPRQQIRWLSSSCLSGLSTWPGNDPPEPDDLIKATEECKRAVELYGNEFPYLLSVLARDLFYMRDVSGALAMTERSLAVEVDPFLRCHAMLNKAVLTLLGGQWTVSAAAFSDFLKSDQLWNLNWVDLIGFADFAYEYKYENAIFMRCLYRKVGGVPRPVELDRKLEKWFEEDAKRLPLQQIYRGGLPLRQLPNARKVNSQLRNSDKKTTVKKKRRRR